MSREIEVRAKLHKQKKMVHAQKIRGHIEQAKSAFFKVSKILCIRDHLIIQRKIYREKPPRKCKMSNLSKWFGQTPAQL